MIENLQISIFEFWIIFKTWMVQFHFPSIPGLFHYQMFALSLTSRMVPCWTFVLPGNAMMVLTPFVSLMTTPYMVLVGMLSSRIGGGSCRETPQLLEPEVMPSTPSTVTWLDLGRALMGGWLLARQNTEKTQRIGCWKLGQAMDLSTKHSVTRSILLSVPLESCLRFLISKFESLVDSMTNLG